jgi:chemotaxis protein methyltransferase CheR
MSKGNKDCVSFLKWAIPKLGKRWEGYRKVHGQVCTRINKRWEILGLYGFEAYKNHLQKYPEEWDNLDQMTHITISRFFRDKHQWLILEHKILPGLVKVAYSKSQKFRVWSAGCASGEEPYSFAILWKKAVAADHPHLQLEIIATDTDLKMLSRAKGAKYTQSSLKEIPENWKNLAFENINNIFHLKHQYQKMVMFEKQDIRKAMPDGPFDIVFCKNLVAMYFCKEVATKLFQDISDRMNKAAWLFLGNHEEFPMREVKGIYEFDRGINIYKKG